MGLFKTKEEKAEINYRKGLDLIAQEKFGDALYALESSVKNGNTEPETAVLIILLELSRGYNKSKILKWAADELSKYPNLVVKFGVHDVNASDIMEECKLNYDLAHVMSNRNAYPDSEEYGKALIECAKQFMIKYPDKPLVMYEIFEKRNITGRERALEPLALGYEAMADSVKWENPRKAAEYLQKASLYHSENNNNSKAQEDSRRLDDYSMNAHCWFCGKTVSGRGIHFVSMPSEITKPIDEQAGVDSHRNENGLQEIYVCRACFTAFEKLGQRYLAEGEQYTDRVAAQLQSEINALRSEVATLRFR